MTSLPKETEPKTLVADAKKDRSPSLSGASSSSDSRSSKNSNGGAYRDFSRVLPDKISQPPAAPGGVAKEPTFPVKLHMILSDPANSDIIAWLPHGRSWRILQQKAFEERVIPLYFRHGRYSSFARQVNGWGFKRVTHGSDYNSYFHEMFLRGMPHLCDKMRRLTSKDMMERRKNEETSAPDFYAISKERPVPESASAASAGQTPALAASSFPATSAFASVAAAGSLPEMELAILERRRAEILDRMRLMAMAGTHETAAASSALGYKDPYALGLHSLYGSPSLSLHQQLYGAPSISPNLAKLLGAGSSSGAGGISSFLRSSGPLGRANLDGSLSTGRDPRLGL